MGKGSDAYGESRSRALKSGLKHHLEYLYAPFLEIKRDTYADYVCLYVCIRKGMQINVYCIGCMGLWVLGLRICYG